MKKTIILKSAASLAVVVAVLWLYLTEFQNFRVHRIYDQAHEELVSGRMNNDRIISLGIALSNISGNALLSSTRKYADSYARQYSQSGDPEKFATGILLENPDLRWANGIGRSITIPLCIMLLEGAGEYPPSTKQYMEEVACTLLPKATQQTYGITGTSFTDVDGERAAAIQKWNEWYQENKFAVLERDKRTNAKVEAQLGKQKEFVEGILELNQTKSTD
jgi:hypothetical protein